MSWMKFKSGQKNGPSYKNTKIIKNLLLIIIGDSLIFICINTKVCKYIKN